LSGPEILEVRNYLPQHNVGRKSAHGSNVHGFKHNIHCWREFEPAYQGDAPQMRGFDVWAVAMPQKYGLEQ